jgi:hypothetical protein
MSRAEFLQLVSHVLIVIGSFILYRTGIQIARVWSEMRAELHVLRDMHLARKDTQAPTNSLLSKSILEDEMRRRGVLRNTPRDSA